MMDNRVCKIRREATISPTNLHSATDWWNPDITATNEVIDAAAREQIAAS